MSAGASRGRESLRDMGLRPVALPSLAEEIDMNDRYSARDRVQMPGRPPEPAPPAPPPATELVWEDPPLNRTVRSQYAFLSQLGRRPGMWARLPIVTKTNMSYSLGKRFPGFEFTGRLDKAAGRYLHWGKRIPG